MKTKLLTLVLVVGFAVVAFVRKTDADPNGSAKLTQLEADFNQATADHGFDGFMSYFADDAVELTAGSPIISGKENIRKALGPWGPDVSLSWKPVQAEMSASGELGYTYGTYVFKANGKDGKPAVSYGKYATIWKKQKDSSWKVIMDMGNTSPAPQGMPQ
jgi:ketosteroid isomerase-like protein